MSAVAAQPAGRMRADPTWTDASLRRLLRARDVGAIVARFEGLCVKVADGFYAPGLDRDDLVQEARLGVAKAVRDFRGTLEHFPRFADLCARRQVISAVIAARRGKHGPLNTATSLDAPLAPHDPDSDVLADVCTIRDDDPCALLIDRDELRLALAQISALTDLEREAILGVALAGRAYSEIGEPKAVDNALQRARRKLAAPALALPVVRRVRVFVDRRVHPTERQAIAAALEVRRGTVLAVEKRKLLGGRDRAPQGRPDSLGRRGQPVWRVVILTTS